MTAAQSSALILFDFKNTSKSRGRVPVQFPHLSTLPDSPGPDTNVRIEVSILIGQSRQQSDIYLIPELRPVGVICVW